MAAQIEQTLILQEQVADQPRARPSRSILIATAASLAVVCAVGWLAQHRHPSATATLNLAQPTAFLSEVAVSKEALASEKATSKSNSTGKGIKHAEESLEKATNLHGQADKLQGKALKLDSESRDALTELDNMKEKVHQHRTNAANARDKAAELKQKIEEMRKQAEDLIANAVDLDKKAEKFDSSLESQQVKADSLARTATSVIKKAEDKLKDAEHVEQEALEEIASNRVCIDMPGVRLQGAGVREFPAVAGKHNISDDWQCTDWCRRQKECKQAVFIWETKTCELSPEASTEALDFKEVWPWYNSSYCGLIEEKVSMQDMLKKIYDQKPWVPPPHKCSWSGDNCIDTKCCADVCSATWDFKKCKDYVCYKKDETFAGCSLSGPDEGWDGTVLGGHPNGEIEPAPEGKLTQGTKLYCFTVVMWSAPAKQSWMSSEAELVNNWKDQGKGIMQCDDYSLFDGLEGGSEHNIASFVRAWNMVKDDGRWMNNDWTIKVDADAVFFPEHFRVKVRYNLRTPRGSTVYLRNTAYKFKFLGALEALTHEAFAIYVERSWECEQHLTQEGGEDYWLEQCLEGLGIDYQTDEALLHDKYAADENCKDPYGVAHHFFKQVKDWNECWDKGENAWNNAHQ